MKAFFLTRESSWAASARIRGLIWKRALESRQGSLTVLCLESLFHLERKTDYSDLYKLYLALRTYLLLSCRTFDLLVINRINYHTLGAVIFCRLNRKKYILDIDDWEYRSCGDSKRLFQRLGDSLARHALLVVVASRFLQKYFSFCARTVYVPSCVASPSQVRENTISENLVFGWMGMVDRPDVLESVQELLGVFHELKRRYASIRLHIIGKGIFLEELKRLEDTYGTEGVRFCYDTAPEDLPALLEKINVGIVSFKTDGLFYEAKSPTRLFQYFSLGKPVIASAVGECRHLIREKVNGSLVGTREELSRAMEEFCVQPALAVSLSRGARAAALEWNTDSASRLLAGALKETL